METLPNISCAQSFKLGFVNYVKFYGRSRRSEYFLFVLIINVTILILSTILIIVYTEQNDKNEEKYGDINIYLIIIIIIIILVTFLPIFSLQVRRLHDTGRSGWYILVRLTIPLPSLGGILKDKTEKIEFYLFLSLIAFFGEAYLLSVLSADSERMPNKYGPSPKYVISSVNLLPKNNYIPPIPPDQPDPQSDSLVIPVTPNQL